MSIVCVMDGCPSNDCMIFGRLRWLKSSLAMGWPRSWMLQWLAIGRITVLTSARVALPDMSSRLGAALANLLGYCSRADDCGWTRRRHGDPEALAPLTVRMRRTRGGAENTLVMWYNAQPVWLVSLVWCSFVCLARLMCENKEVGTRRGRTQAEQRDQQEARNT